MKKCTLIIGFLFLFLGSIAAQTNWDGTGFRFGVQASPTWSWVRSDDKLLEGAGANWGLKLGVMGEKYFAPNYAFIAGIGFGFNQGGFLQIGYDSSRVWPNAGLDPVKYADALPKNAKLHYRLTYVEIPFGLKMRGGSGEDAPMKFFAEAPVITIGFRTKALGDIDGTSRQNTVEENISDDTKGLSLSWGFGAGVEYELASNATLVGGLFFQSQFTDFTEKSSVATKTGSGSFVWKDEKAKTVMRVLTLRIGIYF